MSPNPPLLNTGVRSFLFRCKQKVADSELACEQAHQYLIMKAKTRWADLSKVREVGSPRPLFGTAVLAQLPEQGGEGDTAPGTLGVGPYCSLKTFPNTLSDQSWLCSNQSPISDCSYDEVIWIFLSLLLSNRDGVTIET